ncbi:MAG TPA: condensation domain-containing protein [Terriglobales bacterium]
MLSNDVGKRIEQLSAEKRALLQQRLQHAQAADQAHKIVRRAPNDPRVLSFGQQQLWLVDQLSPGSSAYNVPYPVRIRGTLNGRALSGAINAVLGRHEVLRTMFVDLKGQPFPAVLKKWSVELREIDLQHLPPEQRGGEVKRLLKEDAARPFNLARDPKLRASLYRLGEEEHILLHVSHHISWDLRSKVIFYEELGPLYRAFCAGTNCELPELPIQYADFALWQRRYLQGELLQKLENYWKQQLSGAAPKLELPADHPRPPVQGLRGAKYPMALSEDVLECAGALGGKLGATLYMVLLAAFNAFLFSYTSQEDISVGSPFAGRRKETDAIIGMFINTLVLRTKISVDLSFAELVRRVRETTLGAIAHQDLPFEKIVEAVHPPRDLSRNALFQVNFRLQNSAPAQLELDALATESLDLVDNDSAKFDLALELPSSSQSRGYFEYNTDLFEQATIVRMADHFHALLTLLLDNPNTKLMKLDLIRGVH